MSFTKRDPENGKTLRRKIQLAMLKDEKILVEQNHRDEVNINNIVKRHGVDLIAKTAALQQFVYDDNPNNDFQETMNAILKAQDSFNSIPSEIRKKFDNDPAQFMDYVHNPENKDSLVEMGLAEREPIDVPINVNVVNTQTSETPADPPAADVK